MKSALVLVDLQNDFLNRDELLPEKEFIASQCKTLLQSARKSGIGIVHVNTRVSASAEDAMPHWKGLENIPCVAGTYGAQPPAELAAAASERVIHKRFYSGFESGELHAHLQSKNVSLLVIAGIYTHACVRSTALDAYALGYRVIIVSDAIGSPEALHAEMTREYLEKRGIPFIDSKKIAALFELDSQDSLTEPALSKLMASGRQFIQRSPGNQALELYKFVESAESDVSTPVAKANAVARSWQERSLEERADFLRGWQTALEARSDFWIEKIIEEVGKPVKDAQEEFRRSLTTLRTVVELGLSAPESTTSFKVRYRPAGTILCITPWNNPVAIPVGKIAPALLYGNPVIWKPSPLATRMALLLLDSLRDAGLPDNLVQLIPGGADTVRILLREPSIARVTLTGSISAGRTVASLCSLTGKILQAELGGNNAAIILPGADINTAARTLVRAAFSYSGQRCTAIRRLIVHQSVADEFIQAFTQETRQLIVGDPHLASTDIGPLISPEHGERVAEVISQAISEGVEVLRNGMAESRGQSMAPTILKAKNPYCRIAQEETFGPVAVFQLRRSARCRECCPAWINRCHLRRHTL